MTVEGKRSIILFDGVCNLCDGFVNFVFDRDTRGIFCFVSLQSKTGRDLLSKHNMDRELKTIVYIEETTGSAFTQSGAVLRIISYLNFPWSLGYGFVLVPSIIRNTVYSCVASNRYRWFGKHTEACKYRPGLRKRFLEWSSEDVVCDV